MIAPHHIASFVLALALSTPTFANTVGDPPSRDPLEGGEPSEVYRWKSANGLRYTWLLPEGYEPGVARDVTVILHGTGLDYRWGHWNNPTGIFRPDDIVLSVDGPTPNGDSRLFMGEKPDAEAFKQFLDEMREVFAIDGLFLYGHSQGGFFTIYFAGEYPEAVSGVVAHASGAWNWSKMGKKVKRVPIAFMHGTNDPVVPYRQSPGSRDAYADEGFDLLHLRRMPGYNHWPNAVRATEVIGWCDGMSTEDPAEALREALEILRKKKADQYQYETTVGYSAAYDILKRLEGEGPRAFEDVDSKLSRAAAKWIAEIDGAGKAHVKALRKHVQTKKGLTISDDPWLGHLLAVREDFRGVAPVEEYMAKVGFDKAYEKQAKSRDEVIEAFYDENASPKDQFEVIVAELSKGFLYEGYPSDLVKRLEKFAAEPKRYELSKKAMKAYEKIAAWRTSMEEGFKEYDSLWKKWDGPSKKEIGKY